MSNLVLQPVREGQKHKSVFLLVSYSVASPSRFIKKTYEV